MSSPSDAAPQYVITAENLTKTLRRRHRRRRHLLPVPAGEAFGLLGPNGAGKSTTMKMIGGVSQRTSGNLFIMGLDPTQDRKSAPTWAWSRSRTTWTRN